MADTWNHKTIISPDDALYIDGELIVKGNIVQIETTQIINNLCSGVYSVTITDATGCVSTSVPLILTNPPQINVGNINHN